MLRERNKELALTMLRNLINDIEEDRYIVLDVEMETLDGKHHQDSCSYTSAERVMRLRVRLDERKIYLESDRALKIANEKHTCSTHFTGKKELVRISTVGNFYRFACACGLISEVSAAEVATSK